MLAGIPQNPTYNNPLVNWPGARNRQHLVLQAMVRNHNITRVQADQAFAEDITRAQPHVPRRQRRPRARASLPSSSTS